MAHECGMSGSNWRPPDYETDALTNWANPATGWFRVLRLSINYLEYKTIYFFLELIGEKILQASHAFYYYLIPYYLLSLKNFISTSIFSYYAQIISQTPSWGDIWTERRPTSYSRLLKSVDVCICYIFDWVLPNYFIFYNLYLYHTIKWSTTLLRKLEIRVDNLFAWGNSSLFLIPQVMTYN